MKRAAPGGVEKTGRIRTGRVDGHSRRLANGPTEDHDIEADKEKDPDFILFRTSIARDAEHLIFDYMPKKIAALTEKFELPAPGSIGTELEEQSTPKARKPRLCASAADGADAAATGAASKPLLELKNELKAEVAEFLDVIQTVRCWIQLNVPRMEDGNNFGVSVQEEILSQLTRAEDGSYSALESPTKYLMTRAKLASKVVKYPGVEEYKQAMKEYDDQERINALLCCGDLRNNYAVLYDTLLKNVEKLKAPRSSVHMGSMF